jgi:hypothetical protein
VEYHLDHRVVLDQKPEFKNLYQWSLQEIDAEGKKIGRDEIPWKWDLYFTATELALSDAFKIEHEYQFETDDTKLTTRASQFIRAKLQPGRPGDRAYRRTTYSMFGTTRTISDFELTIEKVDVQPTCRAWGGVSYTAEFDFRDETANDTVVFHLYVPSETFTEYARKIEAGAIGEAVLRVGGVDGFYSDWSPSITTDSIKVLTDGKEHKVEIADDCEIAPPRMGHVDEAELYLRHVNKLEGIPPEAEDDWVIDEPSSLTAGAIAESSSHARAAFDSRAASLLSSVRLAAWIIAGLLLVLILK